MLDMYYQDEISLDLSFPYDLHTIIFLFLFDLKRRPFVFFRLLSERFVHWKIGKTTTTKIECCCCCFPPFVLAPAFFFLKKEKRDGLNAETRTLFLSFFSLGFWLVSRRKGCETNTSWRRRKTGTARAQHREQQRLVGGTRRPPNDAHKREESTVQPMSRYIGDSFVCFLLFTLLGTDDGRRNVKMVRKIRRRKRKKITHEKWWEKKYLVGNEGNKKDIEFRQKNKQKNKKKNILLLLFFEQNPANGTHGTSSI